LNLIAASHILCGLSGTLRLCEKPDFKKAEIGVRAKTPQSSAKLAKIL
jgi:hypothetical protein